MIDYKKELSEVQYQAVTYIDGPELVFAGAGFGKTRVLTYKIAYLIERGIPSNQILALTFTNKASNEMKERIDTLVSRSLAHHIVMGTFHSVFASILRFEVNHSRGVLPYTQNFTIYDASDSETTVKNIIKSMGLDTKVYSPSLVTSICKESGIVKLFKSSSKEDDQERHENIQKLLAGVSSFVAEHRNEEGSPVSLDNYLREIALYTDDENTAKDNTPCVSLMTVHSAKGLEFPVVFVVGMEEDVFPCHKAFEDMSSMEEDRRLFYVAVTRAKQRCYLTGADNRFRNGSFSNYDTSSFIDYIDRRYIQKDYSYGRY